MLMNYDNTIMEILQKSSIGNGGSDAQFTRTPSQPPQLQLLTPKTARK